MTEGADSSHPRESAATIAALEQLAAVLTRAGGDLGNLATRALQLRDELAAGDPLTEAMAAEPRPLIITTMTQVLDQLTTAALAVRRAEARQLQREGASHRQIGEVFGVTRQRVGALLAGTDPGTDPGADPGADPGGARPHRPRAGGGDDQRAISDER